MNKIKEKATSGEVTLEKTSTEIVQRENSIVNFNVESLMAKAIEHGLSPETMEKFLAMRQQLKAEWAKEQYNRAMAAFQSDCPTIQKTKEVKDSYHKVLYSYAPIESIVSQIKGLLQTHGFSYSTSMEVLPDGVKVCVRVTHIDGHSEESCMQVPLGTKTGIMSASQQTAAAQTFAKRYAFLNAFGILTGDEDNDGATIPVAKPVQTAYQKPIQPTEDLYTPFSARIAECDTPEGLDLIANEVRIAYTNKKISSKDLGDLAVVSRNKRKELEV